MTVTINHELLCFVNQEAVAYEGLEGALKRELGEDGGVVSLHIDKHVPSKVLVEVAGIASSLKAKISIVTIPE